MNLSKLSWKDHQAMFHALFYQPGIIRGGTPSLATTGNQATRKLGALFDGFENGILILSAIALPIAMMLLAARFQA